MTAPDPLAQLRQTFAAKVQAQPALAHLIIAALSETLPHLLGQPERVVVDLFKEVDGTNIIYGLHIFDAERPPETGEPYAQVPLLTVCSTNNPKSAIIDGPSDSRIYGTATPALEEATLGVLERRQVAMAFWRALLAYRAAAGKIGATFYTDNHRLSMAGPANAAGLPDVDAILRTIDDTW